MTKEERAEMCRSVPVAVRIELVDGWLATKQIGNWEAVELLGIPDFRALTEAT